MFLRQNDEASSGNRAVICGPLGGYSITPTNDTSPSMAVSAPKLITMGRGGEESSQGHPRGWRWLLGAGLESSSQNTGGKGEESLLERYHSTDGQHGAIT